MILAPRRALHGTPRTGSGGTLRPSLSAEHAATFPLGGRTVLCMGLLVDNGASTFPLSVGLRA